MAKNTSQETIVLTALAKVRSAGKISQKGSLQNLETSSRTTLTVVKVWKHRARDGLLSGSADRFANYSKDRF